MQATGGGAARQPASLATANLTEPGRELLDALYEMVRVARSFEDLDIRGYSRLQVAILMRLDRAGEPLRLTTLAEAMEADLSVASRQMTPLVERELVERSRDPLDGRACALHITTSGRELVAEVRARRDAWLARTLADFPPDDVRQATRVVRALIGAIQAGSNRATKEVEG